MSIRPRRAYAAPLRQRLRRSPAVAVLGARQCGKSTLIAAEAAGLARGRPLVLFDLERPSDLARLSGAPEEDLADQLECGFVLHGGTASYPLRPGLLALAVDTLDTPALLRDSLLKPRMG